MSAALLHQLPASSTAKASNYRPHARLQPLGPRSLRPQFRYSQQLRQQSAPLRGHLHQKDLFTSSARTLGHGLRCYSNTAASFRLQSAFKAVSQATAAPRDTGEPSVTLQACHALCRPAAVCRSWQCTTLYFECPRPPGSCTALSVSSPCTLLLWQPSLPS